MAIAQTKYINIISSVSGTSAVTQRELIGRVFTSNYLVPTNSVMEISGGVYALDTILDYFGENSAEYKFASKYFQVGKSGFAPQKIAFARYSTTATPGQLLGAKSSSTLSELQGISDGTLTITVNETENEYSNINLSSATSFADVASLVTAEISGSGATVTYDADNKRFILATEASGAGNTVEFATGTVATALGFTSGIATISDGIDGQSALSTLSASESLSNNFFSFCFLPELSTEDIIAIAKWTAAQNVKYMFSVTVTPDNASEIATAVSSYDGVALTLDKFAENAGFMPMSRIAAIDYKQPNAAISMNYQQFSGVEASVNTNNEANLYDEMRVNYYGETQHAGQEIAFYQDGVLQGSISDMGVYANEAWLKDSIITNVLNLRLGLNTLPANNTGLSLVMSVITGSVQEALYNGVILPGKTLDDTQKAYITQTSGNTDAWRNVQSAGYYLNASVQKYTEYGIEKYKVNFLLIYAKGDSINYVDGRDIMI